MTRCPKSQPASRLKRRSLIAALPLFAAVWSSQATAQSIVLDVSNLVQNTQSAVKNAQTVVNQVRDYQLQIAQVNKLIKDVRGFNVAELVKYASPQTAALLTDLERARNSVVQMRDTVQGVEQQLQKRRVEAQRSGKTVESWYKFLKDERANGVKQAADRLKADYAVVERATLAIKQVQSHGATLSAMPDNAGGAYQTLAAQMNQLASLSADMMKFTAEGSAEARANAVVRDSASEERINNEVENIRRTQARDAAEAAEARRAANNPTKPPR